MNFDDIKRALFAMMLLLVLMACSESKPATPDAASEQETLEVIYFHTRDYNPAWTKVGKLTQQVLNKSFAKQQSNNTIVYSNIDLGTSAGSVAANKYKIRGNTLIVNQCKGNKIVKSNLTEMANKTIAKPQEFEKELKEKIDELVSKEADTH